MKKTFFALSIVILLFSCKKEIGANAYIGRWELTKTSSNGIIYYETNYPEGNGNTITLTDKGAITDSVRTTDTSFIVTDTYRLGKGTSCNDTPATIIYFGNGGSSIISRQDTLLLLSSKECATGGSVSVNYYRKIN